MKPPTEEELRQYRDVPLTQAAAYLGVTKGKLAAAIQAGVCPIGVAVNAGSRWSYIIPPERLIKWYKGREGVILPQEMVDRIASTILEIRNAPGL